MHESVIAFVDQVLPDELVVTSVLEVGSYDVNGSVRPTIMAKYPKATYTGVDMEEGPGVDVVCNATELVGRFEQPDIVISTEMLEHVEDWRATITALKDITPTNGGLLLTTRSFGFQYHAYPHDYWRYSLDDFMAIFADFEILSLESDPQAPGVFMLARKPENYTPVDLSTIELYRMPQP